MPKLIKITALVFLGLFVLAALTAYSEIQAKKRAALERARQEAARQQAEAEAARKQGFVWLTSLPLENETNLVAKPLDRPKDAAGNVYEKGLHLYFNPWQHPGKDSHRGFASVRLDKKYAKMTFVFAPGFSALRPEDGKPTTVQVVVDGRTAWKRTYTVPKDAEKLDLHPERVEIDLSNAEKLEVWYSFPEEDAGDRYYPVPLLLGDPKLFLEVSADGR